jgi:hypothetical protein
MLHCCTRKEGNQNIEYVISLQVIAAERADGGGSEVKEAHTVAQRVDDEPALFRHFEYIGCFSANLCEIG